MIPLLMTTSLCLDLSNRLLGLRLDRPGEMHGQQTARHVKERDWADGGW